MPWIQAGSIADFGPEGLREIRHGQRQIALCLVDGSVIALDNFCPHRGGPLAGGALHGATIVCPWHAWEFDCRTGACDFNPEIVVKRYPVQVENGEILVEI